MEEESKYEELIHLAQLIRTSLRKRPRKEHESQDTLDGGLEQFKASHLVNCAPSLEDLHRHVISRYVTKWKAIGLLLGLDINNLNIIEADNRSNIRSSCQQMFIEWLHSKCNVSWEKLFTVIESPAVSSDQTDCKELLAAFQTVQTLNEGLAQFKASHLVNCVPSLEDLHRHFIPYYATKWRDIGILLGLDTIILRTMEADYRSDVRSCCKQMIMKWLKSDRNATWGKLFAVIESPAVSGGQAGSKESPDNDLAQFKAPDVVRKCPLMMNLVQHFIPHYAAKWKDIGILLGLSSSMLNLINIDYPTDANSCCREMLDMWLGRDPTASWEKLFTVIESPAISSDQGTQATVDENLAQFKASDIVRNRPLMMNLVQHFIPHYAANWKDIGILLGLDSNTLNLINADHPTDDKSCCREMLEMWLKMDRVASWEKLFTATESTAVSSSQGSQASFQTIKDVKDDLAQFKAPDVVCVRPLLKDLYRHFVPHYATKWKDIGTLLGLNSQVLMMIEADHPNNVKLSCREMLQRWLYMDRTATWEKLFTVIDLPAVSSGQDSSKESQAALLTTESANDDLAKFKASDVVCNRPSLEDLRQHFVPHYATQWKQIGILLGLDSQSLEDIEDNSTDFKQRCSQMLMRWLEMDPTASWQKLFTIIDSPAVFGDQSATDKDDAVKELVAITDEKS